MPAFSSRGRRLTLRHRLAGLASVAAILAVGLGVLTPGGAARQVSAAAGGTYQFASVGALTGPAAQLGVADLRGKQLAVKEINAAGGVNGRKFVLTKFDDQCAPTQSAIVASKIISNPSFVGVIGPICSSAAEASLPVYARGHVEVVADVSAPKITDQVAKNHYKFFARLSPKDSAQGIAMATLAIKVLHKTKIAILYSTDDYGQGILQYAKPAVEKLGGTVVASETYTPTTTKDFTPQLTKIAGSGAEVILVIGYYADTGVAVSQLARAGVSPDVQIICPDSTAHEGFVPLAGSAANGALLIPFYWGSSPTPVNQKFVKAYTTMFHQTPNSNAVYGYEAVYAYAHALKAGATQATLAAKLRAVHFLAPTGQIAFDSGGDLKGAGGIILKVTDGKLLPDMTLTSQLDKAMG